MASLNKKPCMLVEEARSAHETASSDATQIASSMNLCDEHLRTLNDSLKDKNLSLGEKHHFMASIASIKSYLALMKAMDAGTQEDSHRVEWEDMQSAFQNRIRTGVIINLKHKDVIAFLKDAAVLFQQRISNSFKDEMAFKANAILCGEFILKRDDREIEELKYFNTKNKPIYRDTDIKEWFTKYVTERILGKLGDFQERGSGWTLGAILNLMININEFVQLTCSSYIKLPKYIRDKKACINVKNQDDACFAWAVTSALYPVSKNADRTTSYPPYSTVLNLENITMPMTTEQIRRFEQQNSISINRYFLKKKQNKVKKEPEFEVRPFYLTNAKQEKHVNLLLIQDNYEDDSNEDNDDEEAMTVKYHYVWIKDLSRLLSTQLSNHKTKKYFCDRCFNYLYSQERLDKHTIDCGQINLDKIKMPDEKHNILKFRNFLNKIKAPFIIYADLECILKSCNVRNMYQKHEPCSVGYYVKCSYDVSLSFYRSYRGEDCIRWFTAELQQFAEDVETVFLCPLPMNQMTLDEKLKFDQATHCHICEKPFDRVNRKIRDHCHLTGKFRGAAHNGCNINYQDSHVIPVVFHNLSGYDSHFVIKNLASDFKGRIDLLPINKEKYISFTKYVDENLVKFRFIDSFRFMSASLDKLASNLKTYPILKSEFQDLSAENFQLLTRKGVYPYDYFDMFERFTESELPSIDKFYDKLNDTDISDADYAHAKHVWEQFKIQNLGEYSDLYLKTDVLLLADVFEHFRATLLQSHGLDPAHYFSTPGYTWDAMLKYTKIELELLTDIDMLFFIEEGVRGGLSQCSKRYVKANNKYMTDYDRTQPSTYLLYEDVNNLYGYAMSQPLPCGGFAWVDPENVNFNSDDESVGYILEVDLEYPAEVHYAHSDLPFCPEHLSAPKSKEKKLMATLHKKKDYIIYYTYLKKALDYGLVISKFHRALKFKQRAWLKPYIDLNTRLRTDAINDFDKDLYKLLNNAAFGKTMENIRKRSNIKLVTKWEGRYGAAKLIARPEFKSCTIFNENLVAIELKKSEIFYNKPIYIGMCVLEISKTKLYDFHYDYMRSQFGNKFKLCYTDTDSLIYEIECDDVYEVIRRDCHMYFDTSGYPDNNRYDIPRVNMKVPGLMKDELNGKIMTEFVGLRSKSYAYRVEGEDKDKKAKGVKKSVIKNKIIFDDYLECLVNFKEKSLEQNLIRSKKHNVTTITQQKIALSPHDDKRYLIENSYETLPWGHCDIMETEIHT